MLSFFRMRENKQVSKKSTQKADRRRSSGLISRNLRIETLEDRQLLSIAPTIGALTLSQSYASSGNTVTVTASSVADADTATTSLQVKFYKDVNDNGVFDASDLANGLLATQTVSSSGNAVFNRSVVNSSDSVDSQTVFAQATDGTNGSNVASAKLDVAPAGYTAITSLTGLQAIANDLDGNYYLACDINAATLSDSLGDFAGTLDGNGHTISGLTVSLFDSVTSTGAVKNLGLTNVDISATLVSGGLAVSSAGAISNCYVTGEITVTDAGYGNFDGDAYCGLLVGSNGGTIDSCYASGSVTGIGSVGGLVGVNSGSAASVSNSHAAVGVAINANSQYAGVWNAYLGGLAASNCDAASIASSYATGDVTSDSGTIGGFVGNNDAATISGCYASGDVTGSQYAAGFVGQNVNSASVTDCYATGDVNGYCNIGGFIGLNSSSAIVDNCYAAGAVAAVSGNVLSGGFLGANESTISDSFVLGSIANGYRTGAFASDYNSGTLVNCYYCSTAALQSDSNAGVSAATQSELYSADNDVYDDWSDSLWLFSDYVPPILANTQNAVVLKAPKIDSFTASKDGVACKATDSITLSVGSVDSDGESVQVRFYDDVNGDGIPETSEFIGVDLNGSDGWGYTLLGSALSEGSHSILAAAVDSEGNVSNVLSVSVKVFSSDYTAITSLTGLQAIANDLDGDYYLACDINAATLSDSLGDFAGTLDGNGHTISGLTVSLFDSVTSTGAVKNLGLTNVDISATLVSGGLAVSSAGAISNCYVTGEITVTDAGYGNFDGDAYCGLLVGSNGGTIDSCYASGSVTGIGSVGGLVGVNSGSAASVSNSHAAVGVAINANSQYAGVWNAYLGGLAASNCDAASIASSYATGDVTSDSGTIGGFVGNNDAATISGCYASGDVTGSQYAAGFVGQNVNSASVTDCYATGDVNGYCNIGGFIGLNSSSAIVDNCYAAGAVAAVSGNVLSGGFLGANESTISDSFVLGSIANGYRTGAFASDYNSGTLVNCYYCSTAALQSDLNAGVSAATQSELYSADNDVYDDWSDSLWLFSDYVPPILANTQNAASTEAPVIQFFTASQDYVVLGADSCVLTARGVSDIDGDLANVRFYCVYNGTVLGYFTPAKNGENYSVDLATAELSSGKSLSSVGRYTLYAVAVDEAGNQTVAAPVTISAYSSDYTAISTVEELQAVSARPDGKYFLACNINASVTQSWNYDAASASYQGFLPIGTHMTSGVNDPIAFTGIFDGNGHTVNNLYVNRPNLNRVALFCINMGTIRNLCLENVDVNGDYYVAAVIADNRGAVIKCHSTGAVTGNCSDSNGGMGCIGGLVGVNTEGSIRNSWSSATVANIGTGGAVGGLVGLNRAPVETSYSTGAVTGGHRIGGFVGENAWTICDCYATGNASGTSSYVGGFVGRNNANGAIDNCYATGTASSSGAWGHVGGFLGYGLANSSITDCFSTGNVSGMSDAVGAFVGKNDGVLISNCYYNQASTVNGVQSGTTYNISGSVAGDWLADLLAGSHNVYETWASVGSTPTWIVGGSYPILVVPDANQLLNLAEGENYSVSKDTDASQITYSRLTDGSYTITDSWSNNNNYVTITLDLLADLPISCVRYSCPLNPAVSSSLYYPKNIYVLASDDGVNYHLITDMVEDDPIVYASNSTATVDHIYESNNLNTHARYVTFVVFAEQIVTVDEIQILGGGSPSNYSGPVVTYNSSSSNPDETELINTLRWKRRLYEDIKDLTAKAASIANNTNILSQIAAIKEQVDRFEDYYDELGDDFENTYPHAYNSNFDGVHDCIGSVEAALLALNSAILRANGYGGVEVWTSNRWDMNDMYAAPTDANGSTLSDAYAANGSASLDDLYMMNGERRGQVVNLTNSGMTSQTVTISVAGFGDDVAIYKMQNVDSTLNYLSANMMVRLGTLSGSVTLLPGETVQIWIEFAPKSLSAGAHAGSISVTSVNGVNQTSTTILSQAIHISKYAMSNSLGMSVGSWDYMAELLSDSSYGSCDLSMENIDSFSDLLDYYKYDSFWCSTRTLGSLSSDSDSNLDNDAFFNSDDSVNLPADYFVKFDAWVSSNPDLAAYYVVVSNTYGSAQIGSARFYARVKSWLNAFEAHLDSIGISPDRVACIFIDEPNKAAQLQTAISFGIAVQDRPFLYGSHVQAFCNATSSLQALQAGTVAYDLDHDGVAESLDIFDVTDIMSPARSLLDDKYSDIFARYQQRIQEEGARLAFDSFFSEKITNPYSTGEVNGWSMFDVGSYSMNYWNLIDAGGGGGDLSFYTDPITNYSAFYFDGSEVYGSKTYEAVFEGREDYEYLTVLQNLIDYVAVSPYPDIASGAQALLDEAVAAVTADQWSGNVDATSSWSANQTVTIDGTEMDANSVADYYRNQIWQKIEDILDALQYTGSTDETPTMLVGLADTQTGSADVSESVVFTVTFSQPVIGFDADDVELSWVGAGAMPTVTGIATTDGMTYNVTVGGFTGCGKVSVAIPANAACNVFGTPNSEANAGIDVSVDVQRTLYWDANGAEAGTGGDGTWDSDDTTTLCWRNSDGNLVAWTPGSTAVFAGTAGTVTLVGTTTASEISFETNGYVFFGDSFSILSNGLTIDVSSGASVLIYNSFVGVGGLTKTGDGQLALVGASSYSGGTTLDSGTLILGAINSLASEGDLTVNGGTLDLDGHTLTQNRVTLNDGKIQDGVLEAIFAYDLYNGEIDAALHGVSSQTRLNKFGDGDVTLNEYQDQVSSVASAAIWDGTFTAYVLEVDDLYLAGGDVLNSFGVVNEHNSAPTAASVLDVTSPNAAGSYKTGNTVYVDVAFDSAVEVTGIPQLRLSTGSTEARYATYVSGSGTDTLRFAYTVRLGDNVADLDYASTSALTLNGGTIKDASGLNAVLTLASPGAAGSLGANESIKLDTAYPTVAAISLTNVSGTTIQYTVTFSEAVSGVDASDFAIECSGNLTGSVASISGSGTTYIVTVEAASTGTGTKKLRLLLKNNYSIVDTAENVLFNSFLDVPWATLA